jgi:hypothetical protein
MNDFHNMASNLAYVVKTAPVKPTVVREIRQMKLKKLKGQHVDFR